VSNAIKFTPKGGRIDVRLEDMPAGPRITVSDTGRGISPQLLPLIFDRFRQGESVSTRTQGGLGLGLAIVHHVVELHGGRVTAFSAGAGQGATFTIDLPRSGPAGHADTGDDGATQLAPDPGPAEVRLGGLRVLIVEDDGDTGRMLAQALSDRGAHVTTVETAAAALVELARTSPHVLLSDIGLPGEDGYALIGQVRALPASEGGRIPAIALTAFAREADMHRAIEAGFDVHVAKPIDPSELAGVVQRVVRLRTS
jgi:CheY-like chemotaxis protein